MKKVLISGINGFVGQAVAGECAMRDMEVTGIVRSHNMPIHPESLDAVAIMGVDLSVREQVSKVDFSYFDAVINIAGIAVNDPNEQNAEELIRNNVAVQTNVAEEMIAQGATRARLISIGSGAIYLQDGQRIHESSSLRDPSLATPYVVSKLLARKAMLAYDDRLDIVLANPLNHTGRGQRRGFLVSDWALKLTTATNPGNLDTSRLSSQVNMSHVADVANAYIELVTMPERTGSPEYVIGSRRSTTAYAIVHLLADELGVRLPQTELRLQDPVVVDTSHLMRDTKWTETQSYVTAVRDYVAWFREHTSQVQLQS